MENITVIEALERIKKLEMEPAFVEQESIIDQSEAKKEHPVPGIDVVKAFCADHWGLAKADSKYRGNTATVELSMSVPLDVKAEYEAGLESFATRMEACYGSGITVGIASDMYNLRESNKNMKSGGSFDGTDKGDNAEEETPMYHLDNMLVSAAAEMREEMLNDMSDEAKAFFPQNMDYDPQIVISASKLSEDMWHRIRQYSVGASAVASVTGTSPFGNNLSLWHEKLGTDIVVPDDEKELKDKERYFTWGHMAESYIRVIMLQDETFQGCTVKVEPAIYTSEQFPFLTANLDAMIQFPDGHWAIGEFKAPTWRSKEKFEDNNVPEYYYEQMQIQMHLANVDEAYLVALFDRDTITVSRVVRDPDAAMEIINTVKEFWFSNVIGEQEPAEINGSSDVTLKTMRKYSGPGNNKAPEIQMAASWAPILQEAEKLHDEYSVAKKQADAIKAQYDEKIDSVKVSLGQNVAAVCEGSGFRYRIRFPEREVTLRLGSANLRRIQKENSSLFNALRPFLTMSSGRGQFKLSSEKID